MTARTNNVSWSAPPPIGDVTPNSGAFTTLGATGQITSTIVTGTAPLLVTSTTFVPNLYVARAALADATTVNANLTGPITSVGNATSIASQTGTGTKFVVDNGPTLITPVLGVATATSLAIGGAAIGSNGLAVTGTIAVSGQVTSTVATGTAPLVVASTTVVANLNAAQLNGATFAAPGAIGGTTPAAITGTTVTANTSVSTPSIITASGNLTLNPAGARSVATNAGNAIIMFNVSGAGSDQKNWDILANTNSLNFAATNDALSAQNTFMAVARGTGTAITSISIGGNIGSESLRVVPVASAVTWVEADGATTGNRPLLSFRGETNTGGNYGVNGTGAHAFYTGGPSYVQQFEIDHTASADAIVKITGSNGGNATISTSARNLAITPALVCASTITLLGGASFLTTSSALTDVTGASAGTLANAPSVGNPSKWIQINDNGTLRKIPTWT